MAKRAVKAGKAAKRPAPRKPAIRKNLAAKPAAPKAGNGTAIDEMASAVAAVTRALSADQLDALPRDAVQGLMAAVVRAYSAKVQAGETFLPYNDRTGRVSPTDVMITASGLLKAADLQVFELGMWQSYTGR
jgi:hypothetical protein